MAIRHEERKASSQGGNVGVRLHIRGLRLPVRIGWQEHERQLPRPLIVDLALDVQYEPGRGLEGTVDLEEAAESIMVLAKEEFRLIEELALSVAEILLGRYASLERVSVSVSKPAPPGRACPDASVAEVVLERDG